MDPDRLLTMATEADGPAGTDDDRQTDHLVRALGDLMTADRRPAAARLLAGPLATADCPPRLLREAVELAIRLDDPRLALRISARLEPGAPGLTVQRAGLFLDLGRLREAWQLVEDDGTTPDLREIRARTLLSAGLPVLAVDARRERHFGWSEWGRRWWRTGGPLWFVRARGRRREEGELDDRLGPAEDPGEAPDPAGLAAALVEAADVAEITDQATSQGAAEAVTVLAPRHDPARPNVRLLTHLAWALYLSDQEELALVRIREARALEPADPALLDAELTFLKYLDRYVEGLEVAERYAAASGTPAEARACHGDLLDDFGLYALSYETFGPADGLSAQWRAERRRQWWHTGGPLGRLRRRLRFSDEAMLTSWRTRAGTLARVLGSVVGAERVAALRVVADRFTFGEARRRLRWGRINLVARLTAGYAGCVLAGVALSRLAGDLPPLWSASAGLAGGLLVLWLLTRVYRFTRAEPGDRILTRVLPAILAVGAAGCLITRIGGRWALLIGATVLALSAVTALRLVVAGGVRVGEVLWLRRFQRADPRGAALVDLLDVLTDLTRPALRNDMAWRRQWLQTLERVAQRLENDLPTLFAVDPSSMDVLRRRGRGAAAGIRELKYPLVAAPPGTWRRIETVLRRDIAALADGSLGRLHAVDPPTPPAHARPRRQIAVDAVRTLVFAGLPLAVVLTAQPWLSFNETILNWARLLSIGWALLYVLLTADPTFRDKLRTGFALINLGRGTGEAAQLDSPEPEKRSGPPR
ncbi:hypothetical protein AB0F81_25975 [Actinoplanes sp. NPDC024001]|uniref:hypothetical protein n=1 Tax=Actinoplanes sp. NPDC024001 TaxID=3154598 RepID=UPI0033D989EB